MISDALVFGRGAAACRFGSDCGAERLAAQIFGKRIFFAIFVKIYACWRQRSDAAPRGYDEGGGNSLVASVLCETRRADARSGAGLIRARIIYNEKII